MQKSKTVVLSGVGVAVIAAGLILSSTLVHAQTNSKPFSGLAAAVAKKFNLDQSQVETTIADYHQEQRQEMTANMQKKEDERLSTLVSKGKITEAQKQAIIAKLAELKVDREKSTDEFKNMTLEQRKAAMLKKHDDFDAWAKTQGIDPTLLRPRFGARAMMKRGMMRKNAEK